MTLAIVAAGSQVESKASLGDGVPGCLVMAGFPFKMVWFLCLEA